MKNFSFDFFKKHLDQNNPKIWFIGCLIIINTLYAAPVLVGIAGGTGSGKTTLANEIQEEILSNSVIIKQDSYYKDLSHLPLDERDDVNFDHPNSIDFDLLYDHLIELSKGNSIEMPVYSFITHTRENYTEHVQSAPIIIIEGILLFSVLKVRELFDFKIFVDTDDDIRLLRRIERDIKERSRSFDSVKQQYLTTVKPMHDAFVQPSKQHADIIVPNGGRNRKALSMIVSKLQKYLYDIKK